MKKKNSAAARRPLIEAALLVSWLCLVLGNARAAEPAAAGAAPPAGPVPTEVFEGARILRGPSSLAYPARELDHRREGWALINTMISPEGTPYEITVVDSSGNAALDQAAIKAVNEMAFRPATSGSMPVDSSLAFTLKFTTAGDARFASDAFVASFKNFVK